MQSNSVLLVETRCGGGLANANSASRASLFANSIRLVCMPKVTPTQSEQLAQPATQSAPLRRRDSPTWRAEVLLPVQQTSGAEVAAVSNCVRQTDD